MARVYESRTTAATLLLLLLRSPRLRHDPFSLPFFPCLSIFSLSFPSLFFIIVPEFSPLVLTSFVSRLRSDDVWPTVISAPEFRGSPAKFVPLLVEKMIQRTREEGGIRSIIDVVSFHFLCIARMKIDQAFPLRDTEMNIYISSLFLPPLFNLRLI